MVPSAPMSRACFSWRMVSRVFSVVTPTKIGLRPRAVSTITSIIFFFSSQVMVAPSPKVPWASMASTPPTIRPSTARATSS